MTKIKQKKLIITICIVIFLGSFFLSVLYGGTPISLKDLKDWSFGVQTDNTYIIELFRFPRAIKAVIAGSCLAISGLYMQTITKNPIVDPYITGISAGAGIALVLGVLFNISPFYYPVLGFAGGLLVSLLVICFVGVNRFSLAKLVLVGISVNLLISSIISLLILLNRDKAHNMILILSGNLNSSLFVYESLYIIFAVIMLLCLYITPKLNFLRLDHNIAKSISTKSKTYNIVFLILSSALASLSVCAAGILGFIGIIIPHICRQLFGLDFRWLFFAALLLGPSLILLSDYLARSVVYPTELPIGIIISILGAPLFIIFILVKGKKFL